MLRVRSLAVIALTVALVAVGSAPASASHSWGTPAYHWGRTANPFTLQLVDSTAVAADGTNWPSILASNVSTDWTVSTVLDTTIVSGSTAFKDRKQCKAVLGKVRVCNATYGFNGWLGLATIWISGSHIVQGTAKVNDMYFNTSTYNDPNAERHVLCQEVGHTFGLGHQTDVNDSCMNDAGSTLFLVSAVSPNQHDYEQLVTIYTHLDTTTTVGVTTSSPGRSGAAPAPGFQEDGTPVGASPERGNVYVTDLGGGRRIVTFITWAR